MCHFSSIWPQVCGNHYDNVGLHQDKYLLWHLGITCHERHVWHMTPCEPSQHKYRSRTWQSHTSEVTWDDKCQHLSPPHLSVNIRPWDRVLNTGPGQYNGDDWWRSDQDLDNIDTIIVFSKFTTQIKRDSDEDLLLSGRWMMVWQMFPESHRHFLWARHDHNCPASPSSLGCLICNPVLWLAASLLIIQSDVRIWQVSLLGEMSERETDGHKMFHQAAYCSAQPNQLSGINPHQQPEKFLSLFLFWNF